MIQCWHDVMTDVLDDGTFWYCPKCLMRLEGTQEEFPDMTPSEIMDAFLLALPRVPVADVYTQ